MKLIAMVLVAGAAIAGCKDEPSRPAFSAKDFGVSKPTIETIASVDAHVRSRDERLADMHLHTIGIASGRILEHTRAEVDALLGKGELRQDKKVSYAWPDGGTGAIVVAYQDGRAVGIEPHTFAPGEVHFDDLTLDDKLLVREWFGLGTTTQIGGRAIVVGDDFLHVDLAAYDKRYIDGLEAQAAALEAKEAHERDREAAKEAHAREQEAANGRAMRTGFVKQLASDMAASTKADFNFALGDPDTSLVMVGSCNAAMIGKIIEIAGQPMREVGFARIACANGSAVKDL